MKSVFSKSILLAGLISFASNAFASSLVTAIHDEWLLSDKAFATAGQANTNNFALNLASSMKGSGTGNFLIYSDNNAFGTSFKNSLTAAGYQYTEVLSVNHDLPTNLSAYDGIFLSGAAGNANTSTLTNYVNSGKAVTVLAGNSYIPNVEANRWNGFLNNFGLAFANTYNGLQGVFSVASSNALFSGVNQLYFDNGNNVISTGATGSIVLNGTTGGLIGVYGNGGGNAAVPEPSTMILLSAAGLGMVRRRKAA